MRGILWAMSLMLLLAASAAAQPADPAPPPPPAEPPAVVAEPPPPPRAPNALTLVHTAPAEADADRPLLLDFRVDPASGFRSGTVMWRSQRGGQWQLAPIELSATGVWRATIPREAMTDPGVVYFVVATASEGIEAQQFASLDAPHPVYVRGTTQAVEEEAALRELHGKRSDLRLSASYTDYRVFGVTAGTDVDFGPRFSDLTASYRFWMLRKVEYIEAGVGRLQGEAEDSGIVAVIQKRVQTGFKRGWTEVGFIVAPYVGLAARVVLGADESQFRIGAGGVLRIGKPQRTRLVFDVAATTGVGWHVRSAFHVATVPRWPMAFEVEITNEPNSGRDTGEVARFRLGRELTETTTLNFMASYQALTGNDHGVGGGAELLFHF